MEYQGILTGIGDKELGKNLIKPEYDAIINDFIIDKNTILEGLELNGKNLSAGACVLCGYRGIIDTPKELDTTAYVYGKFTLGSIYGGSGEDAFDITTSTTVLTENVNPSKITSAGTYYLLLYVNGVLSKDLDTEHPYPLNAQYSVETKNVVGNAIIDSEVEGVTQLKNDNSNRIATTQYVHNQIEEEIAYGTCTGSVKDRAGEIVFTYTLYRKSRYVIGEIYFPRTNASSFINSGDVQLPSGFIPTKNVVFAGFASQFYYPSSYKINTNGYISYLEGSVSLEFKDYDNVTQTIYIGYQCQ